MAFFYTWMCFGAFNLILFGGCLYFAKHRFKDFPKVSFGIVSFALLAFGGPIATFYLLKGKPKAPPAKPESPVQTTEDSSKLERQTEESVANTEHEFQHRSEMEGITFHPEIWMPGTMISLSANTELAPQTVWFRCIPTPGLPICSHTVHTSEGGWKVYRQGVPTGYVMVRAKANCTFASKVDAFRFCNSDLEWDQTILNLNVTPEQRVKMLLQDKN